jgi:hypothetical protein
MLSAGETSGIMPVTKKGLTPFEQKGSDPFWVAEAVEFVLSADPGLSLAGIELLQALPFEKSVRFSYRQTKTVLEGIFNLVVKQHGLDNAESLKKYPEYAKGIEGNYQDNELGGVLKRLFLGIPKNVFGMDAYREKQISPLADNFILELGLETINLNLDKSFGNLNNLPWGISNIIRKRQSPEDKARKEEFAFAFQHDNKTIWVFHVTRNKEGNKVEEKVVAVFTKGNPLPQSP